MLVRSLTLATLFAFAGPLLAADSDAPLAKELGKARPLVVIAPSSADPTLRGLEDALKDPATQAGFKQRGLVLYSVAQMMGKREDKNLEQQTTMALIRELKLGASKGTKVILVGKDGERHVLKDDDSGSKLDPRLSSRRWMNYLPASRRSLRLSQWLRRLPNPRPRTASRPSPPNLRHRPSHWTTEPVCCGLLPRAWAASCIPLYLPVATTSLHTKPRPPRYTRDTPPWLNSPTFNPSGATP